MEQKRTVGRPPQLLITHPTTGEQKSCAKWAVEINKHKDTLRYRHNMGWTAEQVLGLEPPPTRKRTPSPHRPRAFPTANGKTQSVKQWSAETGHSLATLYWRMGQGWTDEQIINTPRFKSPK